MFDVFYIGEKPNLFAHERPADSIDDACRKSRTRFLWVVNYLSDYTGWDWLWEPSPWQAHQRHAWPSQWAKDSGTYLVPKQGYRETNYHRDRSVTRKSNRALWQFDPEEIDVAAFDFSWHPDPTDPPYIYQFGTQHQATGGPRYLVPGATETKYVAAPRARRTAKDVDRWIVPLHTNLDAFDWTWHPDDRDPPYRYQFPTQWNRAGGPEYKVPGAIDVKFVTSQVAHMLPTDDNWIIPEDIDINSFDFSWTPDPTDPPYRYHFGTQWQKTGGPIYIVAGAEDRKYIDRPRARKTSRDQYWEVPLGLDPKSFDWSWHPDGTEDPFIYQFGTQWQKTGGPRYVVPGATEVKYVSQPRAEKIDQDHRWEVPDGVDVSSFDWTWHPDDTESPYIYQFGTQHQRTGGPRYVVDGASDVKYVDQIKIKTQRVAAGIYVVDHMDGNAAATVEAIGDGVIKTVRYFDNYLDTLRRIAKNAPPEQEWIWICSSICDYQSFDFSWHPEQWQATMLHVFASDGEKFGDTFFMHVPTFQYRADTCQLLEWYDLNFVEDRSVPRRPMPRVRHDHDSHVIALGTESWQGPLALLTVRDDVPEHLPVVPLWREKTKAIVPLDPGGAAAVVPRPAVAAVKTQLYDYAYIDKSQKKMLGPLAQDIIFISYDEPEADANYARLVEKFPRAQRVHGVKGMERALEAAAELSTTPWYFAVFAKTVLHEDWDFSFTPDYFQSPKHYIFYSHNRVNDLVYGEMAVIMYNQQMVLGARGQEFGLDYTLSFPHEVVPIISTYGNFDTSPYHAWRTAFREVSKLYDFNSREPSIETEHRIHVWQTQARGDYAEWVLRGAADGRDFYHQYKDDYAYRKNTFDWQWLRNYFTDRYGSVD